MKRLTERPWTGSLNHRMRTCGQSPGRGMTTHRFNRNGIVMSQNDSTNTKPETAEPKVRRALEANPGATAARIATEAGVGRSTATKILSRWAAEGLVTR